jgi:glycosyltransferase involved in cell wall biosynthesis
MTTSQKTPLSQGNQALRSGQYAQAIQHFCQALITTPSLGKIIVSNIERARNKYQTSRQGADKQHVAVCGSKLSHHTAGRVYTLATLYQTFADVEIIGSIFPQWGREVWEPIRHTAIAKHTFVAEDESRFVEQAIQLVAAHPYDIVHLSKPRAPNIIFGMLYKLIWNAKVLMDMDTHELAQEQTTSLCVDEYIAQSSQFPSMSDLHGQDWTRIAENLATLFDGVTVANTPLQLRYGGSIIRHARDEKRFTPTPDQKRSSKVKHGIAPDKKVVLFFGTACNPQGLLMAAKAIATLQRADLLLVIAGDSPDPTTQAELQAMAGVHVIPIQPIETAPDIVAMADVCLLLQDTARPAAQYQTPAKLSDALAMRIPVIGTPTQALMDVVMTGAILPANTDTLAQQLAQVLDDPQTAHRLSTAGGAYFQKELSFAANQPRLQQATQAHPKPLPEALAGIHPLLSALFPLHHTPPAPHPITPLTPKIAVVAHAYYPELWPEITDRLKAIQHPFDLYITTTPEHAHWVTPTLHGFAHAHITVLPNLGMDVLPFLSLVPTLIEKGYTAVCKLHTKKGTPEQGEPWRRATLDGMIGSEQDFANTAQAFAQHPTLQLAGPAMLYQSVRHLMLGNEAALQDLYMHTQNHPMPDVDWGFFAGNVFWARPALFAPLHQQMAYLQTHITPNYQADGQYIHAIERLTGMLPAAQGGHIGLLHPHANAVQRIAPCTQMGQATMGALTRQYTQLPEDLKRLNDSGLFDEVHYLTQNPSLSGLNINLPTHYLLIGRFNGQTPHPDFDTTYYAQRHAAHIKNQDPFVHYLREGAKAGLQLRPSQQQEQEEIPNFRYRALNTALIDWSEQATKNRDPHRVSIIIPVLNLPELTQACIESLYQYTDPARFELVVVDNGSDEPTALMLRQLAEKHGNLRLMRNDENLNFALGSNLGFAASTGQQVIFLNNDTTVTANWLEPLLEPLSRPEISAVQPRLLYPDGTIQCMGIVFSDKSPLGYPIYAGMKPDESWAGRSRAFQAVTGACMALRAVDFAGVKGFDPVYINGQEDVDLCLRMNQYNQQNCWYAANSKVSHHEGSSNDRNKSIQFNRAAYFKRWNKKVSSDEQNHYLVDGFTAQNYRHDLPSYNPEALQVFRPELISNTDGANINFTNFENTGVKVRRAVVFASYSEKGRIEDYVLYYLRHLKTVAQYIVFVSDNDTSESESAKLNDLTDVKIFGRHEEYDFGSYKIGFTYLNKSGLLNDFDEIIFCNDSCYGPVSGFIDLFKEMSQRKHDFWGLTQNSEFRNHLQSFFLVFKKHVYKSKAFQEFIASISKEENVRDVILKYEVNFTGILEDSGFQWCSYISPDDELTKKKTKINTNLTVFPVFLAESGCQLIKVKAVQRANCNYDGIYNTAETIRQKNATLYDCINNHVSLSKYAVTNDLGFSIILPTYNRVHSIINSIRSALDQSFKNFEIIIVDDGSIDDTEKVIKSTFTTQISQGTIVYIRLPRNVGVSAARNIGLHVVKNKWVTYLDSDNLMRPQFLSVFADSICEAPNTMCFYARFMRMSTKTALGEPFNYPRLISENFIDLGVFVHRKDILSDIGFFDTSLKRLVDWDFIIRATKDNPAIFVPITVMDYNDREDAGDRLSVKESYNDALVHIKRKHNFSYKISTVIVTYNHEKYLGKAIESACTQQGDFVHEVFVFDDCSTDGTWRVVQEYAKKYPNLIKGCRQERNVGQSLNLKGALGAARGDFIAILEGDDYWTDSLKLLKQSRFLIENSDCSMVFSKIEVCDLRNNSKRFLSRQENIKKNKLDGSDFLAEPSMNLIGNFSSCMYRRYILESLPSFAFGERISEIVVAFHFEKYGKIGYLNSPMGVYQQHENGLWTGADQKSQDKSWFETRNIVKKIARKCWQDAIDFVIKNKIAKTD